MSIEHIGTNSMIMDPLTKGLPPKGFHEHTARMGVMSFQDIQFQWEFVFFKCFYDIDMFSVISVKDILKLFYAKIKFLVWIWFDLIKV